MNKRQTELYGGTFCEWKRDSGRRMAGCNHCLWIEGVAQGNALAVTARLRGMAMRHVRDCHPEVVKQKREIAARDRNCGGEEVRGGG